MDRPSYLPARTNKLAEQAVAGLGGASPPHLSIAGNKFTLVDGAGNEKPLSQFNQATGQLFCDIVIADVNINVSKIYFAEKFDPSATDYKPPTCFSDNGVAPSAQATVPQSLTCAACPHNAWGSKISEQSGKQVKACNDLKKIAFVVPGEQLPFLLRIPPATLKNFSAYAKTVASHGADLCEVTTRISFESQGVLKFEPVGWITPEIAMQLTALEATKATDALVGRTDMPNTRPIGQVAQQAQPALAPPIPPATQMPPVQQTPAPAFMAPAQAAPAPAFEPPPQPPATATGFMPTSVVTQAEALPVKRTRGPNKPKAVAPPAEVIPPGVPFAPNAVAPQAPTSSPPFLSPSTASPQQATPMPSPNGGAASASPSDDIPPFLRRTPPAATPAPQQSFGMATPQPAPAGLEAQLAAAFSLPTK